MFPLRQKNLGFFHEMSKNTRWQDLTIKLIQITPLVEIEFLEETDHVFKSDKTSRLDRRWWWIPTRSRDCMTFQAIETAPQLMQNQLSRDTQPNHKHLIPSLIGFHNISWIMSDMLVHLNVSPDAAFLLCAHLRVAFARELFQKLVAASSWVVSGSELIVF